MQRIPFDGELATVAASLDISKMHHFCWYTLPVLCVIASLQRYRLLHLKQSLRSNGTLNAQFYGIKADFFFYLIRKRIHCANAETHPIREITKRKHETSHVQLNTRDRRVCGRHKWLTHGHEQMICNIVCVCDVFCVAAKIHMSVECWCELGDNDVIGLDNWWHTQR